MHERLLERLLAIANVRLVASYTNPEFGLPSDKRIQIFIPDLHLLSTARRAHYTYGTNNEDVLMDVLSELIDLKEGAAADESVVVFHIGDYLDLWRESLAPEGDPDVPSRIKKDHLALVDLMEDPRLNAHFLLGNHDFDLYELTAYNKWERRFFLPSAAPRVMVMHGDYFDWVERKISARLRDIAVYLFSQGRKATSEVLGMMQELSRKQNAAADYTSRIQRVAPAPLGSTQAGDGTVPAEFNVQRKDKTVSGGLLFLDTALKECVKANSEFSTNVKTVIIGHTHHARIAVGQAPDGTPFTLIDTGAWIENCVEAGGGAISPNAQITALSADQVRIYQLDRKN